MQEIKNEKISLGVAATEVGVMSKTAAYSGLIARFVVLFAIAVCAPIFGSQYITGTLVNATLFLSVALIGVRGAILIGVIPSLVSLSTGLIAIAIAPMVPFIIFSNALLIVVFASLKNKNYWGGIVSASVLKFAFLSVVSSLVIGNFVSAQIASGLVLMMGYPQLFTALSGGILASLTLRIMGKFEK
ncbi:MAG: iron hydrogenase [Candidatus Pacebacteria bacterium]|nr:iron hydrogenase [Candidatus Paceibacterota bacterium]